MFDASILPLTAPGSDYELLTEGTENVFDSRQLIFARLVDLKMLWEANRDGR